ncbi:unnamed protein product [Rotaria sp. Silwood2]|nr:unnamed protein product [Rotaria sp. Silwood2]CAF4433898.1 unnamed protein product [Rotaria sp. Silwood2]
MLPQIIETDKQEGINFSFREVQYEINQSQQEGISGVPHFRINDNIEFSGAKDSQIFIQAFRKAGINL